MLQNFVILGAVVQIIGIFQYIKDTIKGSTKPNRITWLLWSISPLIASVASITDGVMWAALPVFMSGFAPLLVFIFSFANKKSFWHLTKNDYFCATISIFALILWWLTKEPVIAIIFSIISDGFAAIPTIYKAWKHPETETIEAYTTGLFNVFTTFFVLKTFKTTELAFPIYLAILNLTLVLIIYSRKTSKKV